MASSIAVAPAKNLTQKTHVLTGKLAVTEIFFDVPQDHCSSPSANEKYLRIFARRVRRHETPIVSPADDKPVPYLVYFQGGPGMRAQHPKNYGWLDTFLDKGYQLLFLDQRGTGLSSPVTPSTLAQRGDAHAQAAHLKLYRADSIVRDCEALRKALLGELDALAANTVPVYASAYTQDMYVPFDLACETAAKIKGCKLFTTNLLAHTSVYQGKDNGLLDHIFALRDDAFDLPMHTVSS